MTKRTIRIIILLMSLAMIGLVSYQVYWIDNAIRVNDTQFKQNVHEALNNVAHRLEKEEVYHAANQLLGNHSTGSGLMANDTNSFLKRYYTDKYSPKIQVVDSQRSAYMESGFVIEDSMSFGEQSIRISYFLESNIPGNIETKLDSQINITDDRIEVNFHAYQSFNQEIQQDIRRIQRKSEMLNVVLDEIFSRRPIIENRINKDKLDDLIDQELKSKGINLSYDYAVVDRQNDRLVFNDNISPENSEILNPGFSVRLFPNDLYHNNYFLTVFFPKQAGFLLKKIWLTLTSSILLVLLIIFLFAYAIFAILRQKKVSEIKNDFINNMTHEFKTPISTIALACEALQDPEVKKNSNFVNNYMKIIGEENVRLKRQVEKVLQMATLDKKDYKLNLEEIDLHKIIDNAVNNINIQVTRKGGKIEKKLIADNNIIISDEVHISNIIYNLLDNANKYSKENPKILVETEDHHQGVLVRITDQGLGMSNEELDKIFEKFYRVPTGNLHDVKGFGLGLAYVKTMLTVLGGHIKVKSKPGTGSVFEIILPINNYGSN